MSKQFVKAKPLNESKDRPANPREPRDPRKNNNRKYEEKASQPRDAREHIKQMLNAFQLVTQPSAIVLELQSKYSRFFVMNPSKPEPEREHNFNDHLWIGGPKKEYQPKTTNKQMSSDSSDPNWESDEEKEVKLVSKKIDEKIIEKVNSNFAKLPTRKINDLQRHEREFLEDYYKKNRNDAATIQEESKAGPSEPHVAEEKTAQAVDWIEYNPKVNALIDAGFIQKIDAEGQEEDQFSMEDFSFEDEGEREESPPPSSSSSEDDDDMLIDDGPRTTVINKHKPEPETPQQQPTKFMVKISSHMFSFITEQAGLNPHACTWVISNRKCHYQVSTQYMDEIYVSQELFKMLPYISLNHSEFVHYDDIETERALEKFKKFNSRRKTYHKSPNYDNKSTPNKNYANKKPIQYKPRK